MRCKIEVSISIIVPVYNVGDYLERCVDSLISQTTVDQIEILLIDDGSTDHSGVICDEYSKKFPFITTIHQRNKGVSAARNTGINNSTGEYIAFVDADDFVDSGLFEKMTIDAQKTGADLIVFDYWVTYEDGSKSKYRRTSSEKTWSREESLKEFLSGGLIGINLFDKLFKRSCVNTLRFDERIKVGEDLFFIFNFLLNTNLVYGSFQPGYHYFQRNGSAMKDSFSEKYFDAIVVSERIRDIVSANYSYLQDYAEALLIYSEYKTLERAHKFHAAECFEKKLNKYRQDIKNFRYEDAFKYMSVKKFAGFCLMKLSPRMYLLICHLLKI